MACDARIIIIQIWIAALVLEELEYFGGKKLIWSGQILDEAFSKPTWSFDISG